jgi:thioesterase domain-containing protein
VRYLHEIRTRQANGPYYLGGHSFGGLVAFEIARRLEAEGEVVELLALFDTFSPLGPPPMFGTEPHKSMASRVREWMQLHLWGELRLRKRSVEPSGFFHLRTGVATLARSFLLMLWGRVREFCHAGVPRLLRALEDVSAANRLAHFLYVPQAYSGRVAMFRASARSDEEPDVLAGWRAVVKRIELYEVPGDHVNMVKEPHVRALAEQLRGCLDSKDGIRDAIGAPLRREPNGRAPEQWDRLHLVHL